MPHRSLPPLRGRDREAGITRHPNFYIRPSFRTSLLNIALYVRSSNQTRRCSTKPLKKLFARSLTQVFRPPGPDRRDSFFAGRCPPWTFRPGSAAPWQLTRRSSTVSAFLSNELIVMVAGGLPARPSSMTALISELDGDQTPPIASLPPGNSKSAPKLHSSVPT
jgi:hypothetical protein